MGKSQPALNYKIEKVEYEVTRYPILGGGGTEESYLGANGDIVIKNIILGNLPKGRELTVNFELFDLNADQSTTPKLRGTDIPIITIGKSGYTNNKINVETKATTKDSRKYFAGEDGGLDVQIRVFELKNVGSARMAVFEEQSEIYFTLNIDLPVVDIVQEEEVSVQEEQEEEVIQEEPQPTQTKSGRSVVTVVKDEKPTQTKSGRSVVKPKDDTPTQTGGGRSVVKPKDDTPTSTVQRRLYTGVSKEEDTPTSTVQKRLYTGDKTAQVEEEEEVKVAISDPVDPIVPQTVGVDRYTTVEGASSRAKLLGCNGSHAHTVDGKTVYMPCVSMEEYQRVTADESTEDDEIIDFDEVFEQEVAVQPEILIETRATRDVNVPSESDKIALQVALNEANRSNALNEAIEQLRAGAQDQINDLAGYSREERIRLSDIIIQTVDETIVQLQQEYNDDRQEDSNLLYEVSINETSDTTVLSGTLPPGFVYINPSLPLQQSFTPVFGDLELPTEQSIEIVTDDQIGVTEVDEQLDEISEEARLAQTLCDTEEDCDTLNY